MTVTIVPEWCKQMFNQISKSEMTFLMLGAFGAPGVFGAYIKRSIPLCSTWSEHKICKKEKNTIQDLHKDSAGFKYKNTLNHLFQLISWDVFEIRGLLIIHQYRFNDLFPKNIKFWLHFIDEYAVKRPSIS